MSVPADSCPFHQTGSIHSFDALDPDTRSDPMPFYDWLREAEVRRLYKLPQEEVFYLVHRYEDVKMVLGDTERFSSQVMPTRVSPFFALMDEPGHKRIRQVVAELFSADHLRIFEPGLRKLIQKATSNLADGQSHELFETWADVIPLGALAALFDFDGSPESLGKLHSDAVAINRALFVTGGTGPRRNPMPTAFEKASISFSIFKNLPSLLQLALLLGAKGTNDLWRMLRPARVALPGPRPDYKCIPSAIAPMLDLMLLFARSLLRPKKDSGASHKIMQEHIQSGMVTLTEMVMAGSFVLFAGYETTASMLSNCFVHLARHPGTFKELKRDPSKLEPFIEESLRYYTPVGRFLRRANTDVVVGAQVIPSGSMVIVMPGAANTDPDKFSNGCAFDPGRENNRMHLSFGRGAHFCVGAPLARMQVTMALKELLHMAKELSIIAEEPLHMVTDRDNGILRYEKIRVVVTHDAG